MPDEKDNKAKVVKKIAEKKVSIVRVNPEKIKQIFANDFMVSHNEEEFFLTFSIMEPFHIETEEDLAKIKTIEAVARVKIILTPNFTRRVSKALVTNIEGYDKKFKE